MPKTISIPGNYDPLSFIQGGYELLYLQVNVEVVHDRMCVWVLAFLLYSLAWVYYLYSAQ